MARRTKDGGACEGEDMDEGVQNKCDEYVDKRAA